MMERLRVEQGINVAARSVGKAAEAIPPALIGGGVFVFVFVNPIVGLGIMAGSVPAEGLVRAGETILRKRQSHRE